MKKIFIIFALIFTSISVSQARTYYFQDLNELVNAPDNEVFCDVETGNCNYDTSLDVELSFVEESTYLDLGVDASIPYTISGADKDSVTLSITSDNEDIMTSANMTVDTDNNTINISAENINKSGEVRIILTATNSEGGVVEQAYTYLDIATISSKNMLTLWTVEAGETVSFPFSAEFVDKYDGHVDWGDDSGIETFENTKIQDLSHTYAEAGTYEIRIDGGFYKESNFTNMFREQTIPEGMDISQWDVSHVTNMQGMFISAIFNDNFDISSWNIANVYNIGSMFCYTTLPNGLNISSWDTSKVYEFAGVFYQSNISSNIDLSGWNIDNAKRISALFYKADISANINLSGWNTSSAFVIGMMFTDATMTGNIMYNKGVSKDIYSSFLQTLANEEVGLPDSTTGQSIIAGGNSCSNDDINCILARKSIIAKGWTIDDATVDTDLSIDETTALKSRWTVNAGQEVYFPVYPVYNGIIDWGDGTIEEFDDLKTLTHTYAEAGTYITLMNGLFFINMNSMFQNATIPAELDISMWNTSNVESMSKTFENATLPAGFDISLWDVSNVKDMWSIFQNATIPEGFNINNWDTSNVDRISYAFADIDNIPSSLNLSLWDTSNVTIARNLFQNTNLPEGFDISKWDMSSCTYLYYMFYNSVIPAGFDISSWNVSNVTMVGHTFQNATIPDKFNLSGWDLSSVDLDYIYNSMVYNIAYMFSGANIQGDLIYDEQVSKSVYSIFVTILANSDATFPDSTTGQKIYVGSNTCAEDDTDCLSAEEKLANKGWVITRTTAN